MTNFHRFQVEIKYKTRKMKENCKKTAKNEIDNYTALTSFTG